jgi:hypothetical protein
VKCGHPGDPYVAPSGKRSCRICRRTNKLRWKERHKKPYSPPIYELAARLKHDGLLHVHWSHFGDRYAFTIQQRRSQVCEDEARHFIFRIRDV